MNIVKELSVFNKITFYEDKHKYYIDKKELTSATRFIGKHKPAFDSDYWSQKKADERGISQKEILAEWDYKRDFSCEKGTELHLYAENKLNNKIVPFNHDRVNTLLGEGNKVYDAFNRLTVLFDQFYKVSFGRLIPVRSELVVGDADLGICGMVDQIFYNEKTGKLNMYDWKTNKEIKESNRWQKFSDPIGHLDVCEMNTYSLQLSLYKYIIEKNTNLEIDECYIVWFFEDNPTFKLYKCHDFTNEIKKMLVN